MTEKENQTALDGIIKCKAWQLGGDYYDQANNSDAYYIRVKGGKAVYEAAFVRAGNETVLLARLEPTDDGRLRQINRRVPMEQDVELVPQI